MKVSVLVLVCYTASVIQASPSIDKDADVGFQNDLLSRRKGVTCEAAEGKCMSKEKCDGKIRNWGKCEEKKDVCCVSTDDGGPKPVKPTGEPEMMKCKDMEGTCISKKDNCEGTIKNHWKCKGEDICCDGNDGGPKPVKPTGEPEIMKCKDMEGTCISKKDDCEGTIKNHWKCKGEDICCDGKVGGPKPPKPTKKCKKVGGKCKSKKDCDEKKINPLGKCKESDVCCGKKIKKCKKIGGKCKPEKDCNGEMSKMGKCKGKKDVCCIKNT